MKTQRRLQVRIVAPLVLVVCAVLGGVAAILWQQHEEALEDSRRDVTNLARVIEAQVRGNVEAVDIALTGLAEMLPVLPGTQHPGDEDINTVLRSRLAKLPFVRAIWVTNAAGDRVHDTDRLPAHFNFSKRPYFSEQRDKPQLGLYLGPPIVNASGVWFMSASRRINHADGSFAGVVVAAIEPRYFDQFFASVNLGETGVVAVLTSDSVLVARAPALPLRVGQVLGDKTQLRMALDQSGPASVRRASSVDGVDRIYAYLRVGKLPLVVVVGRGVAEDLAAWRDASRTIVAAALALIVLIVVLAYLEWQALTRSRALNESVHEANIEIQRGAQELTTLLDAIPDLVFEVTLDGRIHAYRTARRDLLAAPPDVFMGALMSDVLPPEASAVCMAAIQEAHLDGYSLGRQYELVIGQVAKWFEASVARKAVLAGQEPRFVFLARDITDRKISDEALHTALDLLEYSQTAAKVGGWQLNIATGHLYWTAETYRIHETSPAEFNPTVEAGVGYFLPESRQRITLALQAAMERGEGYALELETLTTKGTRIDVFTTCTVTMVAGKAVALTGIFQDITERKNAQRVLRESQGRLAGVIESAMDAIVSVDSAHRIVLFNSAAEKMFGRAAADMIGQPLDRLIPEKFRAGHSQHISDYGSTVSTSRAMGALGQLRAIRANGEEFPIEASISQMTSNDEKIFTVIVRDITQRQAAERALLATNADLARSNAELEQFAHVASHDLQEPLRSISSTVQLLQHRYKGALDARADEFIAHAVGGVQRMQLVIDDLLAYSRIGAAPQVMQVIDLNAALQVAQANLSGAIAASQALISHDELPSLMANPVQISQLFQNLLANALKFRGAKPAMVHVGARQDGAEWVISVADQGIGIEPQYFERIFKLFQRLHSRTEYPGTGIGLTICQKIVERHGGRIWVESVPGEGTTFYFTLPIH